MKISLARVSLNIWRSQYSTNLYQHEFQYIHFGSAEKLNYLSIGSDHIFIKLRDCEWLNFWACTTFDTVGVCSVPLAVNLKGVKRTQKVKEKQKQMTI